MSISTIKVGICLYPGAMYSAVYGLQEMFLLANDLCESAKMPIDFVVELYQVSLRKGQIPYAVNHIRSDPQQALQILVVPPSMRGDYYEVPSIKLKDWIVRHHQNGTIICSICAGTFILASTGLLDKKRVTTHWKLERQFSNNYPKIDLDIDQVLINNGDTITAGGIMSWVDLGMELIAQFVCPSIMRQLGKHMVVDTGRREQRHYKCFTPRLTHKDSCILNVQHYIHAHFKNYLSIKVMLNQCHLGERTFIRRFFKATALKPTEYVQHVRIRKACEFLEETVKTIDLISQEVGYEDVSPFRKIFGRITGLTPGEYRKKFLVVPS